MNDKKDKSTLPSLGHLGEVVNNWSKDRKMIFYLYYVEQKTTYEIMMFLSLSEIYISRELGNGIIDLKKVIRDSEEQ